MSLFDVIKYPISHPPSVEELNALPADVINILRKHFPSDWSLNKIANFIQVFPNFRGDIINEMRKSLLNL